MSEAMIGLEVRKLDEFDPRAPWQITVDACDDGKMVRYTVRGSFYEKKDRTVADIARVLHGMPEERQAKAEEMDRLDREAAAKIEPIIRDLQREQIRVLYGQEGVDMFDQEAEG